MNKTTAGKNYFQNCFLTFLISFISQTSGQIDSLQIAPVSSGYGANGPYEAVVDSILHPGMADNFVYFFRPRNFFEKCPIVFFCHGIGENNPQAYGALITHIVSRGIAVVYSTYPSGLAVVSPQTAYAIMWEGFTAAVKSWGCYIDLARIGFLGHSYGGGAVPALAYKALVEKKWGKKGALFYIMAPWYSYNISQKQLASFPGNAVMIMEVFAEDKINDHRMAKDIFCAISIPDSRKTFVTLYSDSGQGAALIADHNVPLGKNNGEGVDALDFYGIYRQFDALSDFSFANNKDALGEAVGTGSELRNMGNWRNGKPVMDMSMTKNPEIFRDQSYYLNFWSHAINPRFRYINIGGPFIFAWFTPRTLWHYYLHLFGKA